MSGSGLFSKAAAVLPHLLTHGLSKEVADIRSDLNSALSPLAAITVDEFVTPAASGAALLLAATATVAAPVTVLAAGLIAGGLTVLATLPRNITFTTAGVTPANVPLNAVITGTNRHGAAQTETVVLSTTAGIALGVKLFSSIVSVVYPAAGGTAATVAIGIGNALPLGEQPKVRAGLAAILREVAVGALVTTGTLDATRFSYTPAAAANGTNSYAVYYEFIPTLPAP